MLCGPDFSDSEDSLFSDDCDYDNFKEKVKSCRYAPERPAAPLTDEQKRIRRLNDLFVAISAGNTVSVVEALNDELDVNADLRDGWTPILLCVSYGKLELALELVDRGADVRAARHGVTALMMACNCPDSTSPFEKTLAIAKLLTEKGADVNATDRKRMTALMFASNSGNLGAVRYILPLADRNAVDNQRWSALTWAVSSNRTEVVKFLLDEGFDPHLQDVRGQTPLDMAKNFNFEEILNLFPPDKEDVVYEVVDKNRCSFEDHFSRLDIDERPRFFLDVCDMLQATGCRSLVPLFYEKNVGLYEFLHMSDSDLKELGVALPFQRHRIRFGLFKFYKHPYHPKSIHRVAPGGRYSNLDVSIQLLSAVKQALAMDASLAYLMKSAHIEEMAEKDATRLRDTLKSIRIKIRGCELIAKRLVPKIDRWDRRAEPPDLITGESPSCRSRWWTKTAFVLSGACLILYLKTR